MQEKRAFLTVTNLFLGILAALFVLKMIYATVIPLTSDEAYHWEWSRHLALGYYDHPPMVAWLIALFTAMGGTSLLWVRLTAIICLSGTTYLTYLLGREVGGERVGVTAGFLSLAATAMAVGSIVVSTDSPLILFWQLTIFLIWLAVKKRQPVFWYLAGVSLGLGLLSKFLMFPLIAGILLFLLLSPADRYWLKRKEPYLALGIALLVFSPFVIWNSRNGWTTFVFNLTRHPVSFSLTRPFEFLVTQAFLLSPVLYAGMLWSLFRLLRRAIGRNRPESAEQKRLSIFILCSGWLLPVLLFFEAARNLMSAHWPIAAYGAAIVGLAVELSLSAEEKKRQVRGRLLGRWFLATAAAWTTVIVAITLAPDLIGRMSVRGHTINEGYGWKELGRAVSVWHRKTGGDNPIATDNYALASMISFYTPGHLYVSVLGPGSKHGRAYDAWDRWSEWVGRDVLFAVPLPITPSSEAAEILRTTCERYELLTTIRIRHRGRIVRRFYLALGRNLRADPYVRVREHYRW